MDIAAARRAWRYWQQEYPDASIAEHLKIPVKQTVKVTRRGINLALGEWWCCGQKMETIATSERYTSNGLVVTGEYLSCKTCAAYVYRQFQASEEIVKCYAGSHTQAVGTIKYTTE